MLLRQVRDTRADAEAVRQVVLAARGEAEGYWSPPRTARFHRRVRHLADTDPGGCWLAEDTAGRPVGAALASRREGLWGLSLLVVDPRARGKGVGTALLRRAMTHARGALRGMICGNGDPLAAR